MGYIGQRMWPWGGDDNHSIFPVNQEILMLDF